MSLETIKLMRACVKVELGDDMYRLIVDFIHSEFNWELYRVIQSCEVLISPMSIPSEFVKLTWRTDKIFAIPDQGITIKSGPTTMYNWTTKHYETLSNVFKISFGNNTIFFTPKSIKLAGVVRFKIFNRYNGPNIISFIEII